MSVSFAGTGSVSAATPFQRVVSPNQLGVYLALEQSELLRIKRYTEHWKFYLGQQWAFQREDGEPLVTLNYAKALVYKSVAWLVGKGMTIKVNDALRGYTLPALWEVWKYNSYRKLLYDIATMGAVTGDVFVLITYVAPTVQARRINPHTGGQIRIQLLNSEQVYPQWDPIDTNVLVSVRIETVFYDGRTEGASNGGPDAQTQGELRTRRLTQIITRDEIIEQYQGAEPVKKPNPLGEIALVHIPNESVPGEYYGMSDLDAVLDLNREINEKSTDISDIINYHSAPTTVITGAKVKNLERSARNIWSGFPEGAKVFNLELESNLAASLEYWDRIKKSMMELSSTPEGSLGGMQAISNTSGVALHTQYGPLVEKTDRKKATYQPGLTEINYFILRTLETVDPGFRMPMDLCKVCGGRIATFTDENGRTQRKCFVINKRTFEFMPPEEVKIRFMRQFSFGDKAEELPYKQVLREHGKIGSSFWDPEPEQTEEEAAAEAQASAPPPVEGELAPPAPEPGPPKPPQMTAAQIEVPPEPEQILLRTVQIGQDGKEVASAEKRLWVVPTGCEAPEFLNPYEAEVVFNDTVPKDKQLQADLFVKYRDLGLVSKRWMRRQIPDIEDPEEIEREIADERGDESAGGLAAVAGNDQEKSKSGTPQDELSRTVGPPFGSNLPGG